jgi:hypothetical protein
MAAWLTGFAGKNTAGFVVEFACSIIAIVHYTDVLVAVQGCHTYLDDLCQKQRMKQLSTM